MPTKQFLNKIAPSINGIRYEIPLPKLSPEKRFQRRLSFRNTQNLYKRKCDLTGKQTISFYSADKPFPVYERSEWFSDKWDGCEFGRDFDFNRPFFEQFQELVNTTPHWDRVILSSENSDYCVNCYQVKNSYLLTSSGNCENCLYGTQVFNCQNCIDNLNIQNCTLAYQCIDSENLYNCQHLQNCKHCHDSFYSVDCQNCEDIILCAGLRNKKYCIKNEQYDAETYHKLKNELLKLPNINLYSQLKEIQLTIPHRALHNYNCQDCRGDYLFNCKNVTDSYFVFNSQDSSNIQIGNKIKDCHDCSNPDFAELCYETMTTHQSYQLLFSENVTTASNTYYSSTAYKLKNCFGCCGLKNKEFCILNKQYTEAEYNKLVPQIIKHMQQTQEWGEFFPSQIGPFGYNESEAQEHFPLTKETAKKEGFNWYEEEAINYHDGPKTEIPDAYHNYSPAICKKIITCNQTKKPFKIIQQELAFYQKQNIPLPQLSPKQRHENRLAKRNKYNLHQRSCHKCQKQIISSYSLDQPELIYCDECYLNEKY